MDELKTKNLYGWGMKSVCRNRIAGLAIATSLLAITSVESGARTVSIARKQSDQLVARLPLKGIPGCTAAVGQGGVVVWSGASGQANLETGLPLNTTTIQDIGSTSKQFTAAATLLLVQDQKMRLSDTLDKFVPDLPSWARNVTVANLIHHTSGIPDYTDLLIDQGFTDSDSTTQQQAVEAIRKTSKLKFKPGAKWNYSNSNYILLAEAVQKVSGKSLPKFLEERIFKAAGLEMIMDPTTEFPNKARSYKRLPGDKSFKRADSKWEQLGDGAIQTTPIELVKWADNYRTGWIGGEKFLAAQLADAVPTGETPGQKYGAGIIMNADGTLEHPGTWAGFLTGFAISKDRRTAVALTCNGLDFKYEKDISAAPFSQLYDRLRKIWF